MILQNDLEAHMWLADLVEADFEHDALTFRVPGQVCVKAGEYLIIDRLEWKRLWAEFDRLSMGKEGSR